MFFLSTLNLPFLKFRHVRWVKFLDLVHDTCANPPPSRRPSVFGRFMAGEVGGCRDRCRGGGGGELGNFCHGGMWGGSGSTRGFKTSCHMQSLVAQIATEKWYLGDDPSNHQFCYVDFMRGASLLGSTKIAGNSTRFCRCRL